VPLVGGILVALPAFRSSGVSAGGAVIRRRGCWDGAGTSLALMIPVLGIIARTGGAVYWLHPILRNTYTGVRDAAPT
jgi:hypothetical protein